jgi:hypothetical protein
MTTAKIFPREPGDISFNDPLDVMVIQAKLVDKLRPQFAADADDICSRFPDQARFSVAAKSYIRALTRNVPDRHWSTRAAIANAAAAEFARRGPA